MHTFAFVSYSYSSHHPSASLFLYHQNTQVLLDCSQWKRALRTVHAFKKCSGEIVPDTPLRYTSCIGILLLNCNPILDKLACVGHLTIYIPASNINNFVMNLQDACEEVS